VWCSVVTDIRGIRYLIWYIRGPAGKLEPRAPRWQKTALPVESEKGGVDGKLPRARDV